MPPSSTASAIRLLLCAALACWSAPPLHAAPHALAFTTVDSPGADSRAILAMLQDRQGFVWIGTIEGGLFRHDGHKQVRYMNDPSDPHSLPGGRVTSLLEDEAGRLWVGTDEGMARFDPVTNNFTRFLPTGGPNNSHIVRRIVSDYRGGIWIATWGGLQHFDTRTGSFQIYQHDDAKPDSLTYNDVNAVAVDNKGGVWAATWPGGVDYLAAGASGFQHFRVDDPARPNPKANDVRALYFDSAATLWMGSADGLVTWKSGQPWDKREALPVQAKRVTDIDEDRTGDLWISTRTSGLLRWDRERHAFQSYRHRAEDAHSLNSDAINTTMRDRSGTMWIGSLTDGVSRANLGYHGFERYVPRDIDPDFVQSSNFVRSIGAAANNQLWLALDDGLALFDPVRRAMVRTYNAAPKRPGAISSNVIYSTYQAPEGTLWVGTSEGLNRLDRPDGDFKVIHFGSKTTDFINAIAPGKGGVLWLATGTALLRYDPASGAVESHVHDDKDPDSRAVNGATTVLEDGAGRVWSGEFFRSGGLDMRDPVSGKFRHFRLDANNPSSLSSDRISSLHEDADGSLWVGTSKGLNHIVTNKNGSFEVKRVQEKGELGTRLIEAIRSDKNGMIWVTTAEGLSKLDPLSNTATEYSVEDGLTEGFYMGSAANSSDGFLYFGSSSGITAVNTAIHSSASRPPQLAITDISVLNHSLGGKNATEGVHLEGSLTQPRSLTLPWNANTISIEFAVLHFAEPRRNTYSYWLEGFDTQPVADASHPVATYTNLPPGKYRFHLQGTNNKGVASRDEIILPITITPPLWQTWWSRMAAALVVMALMTVLYRWSVRRLTARARQLGTLLDERTEALKDAQRKLSNVAATDKLTGIANRRCFDDQLAREWRRAAREHRMVAAGLVELDHFSAYREHYGQQRADDVLRKAAEVLSASVQRAGDLVARHGAEQFAFLAPATTGGEALQMAQRMETAIRELGLPNLKAPGGMLSASIGVAAMPADHDSATEDLMLAADQALHRARSEGGKRSVLARGENSEETVS